LSGPTLVVMAAGIGSRYGGLKQIEPVGPGGEIIMDYSIYDALRAGFEKVVFVLSRDIEDEFRQEIGERISERVETACVFQELTDLPAGFGVPPGRKKPWGTGHAVLAAAPAVDGPFGVINADDFYGAASFRALGEFLKTAEDSGGIYDYCMVGFVLWNTLSDHGHVARGVCSAGAGGMLREIHERTRIEKFGEAVKYTEDGGETWVELPREATVSMNAWGFTPSFFGELGARFPRFLEASIEDPKAEFFVPEVVGELIREGEARVRVLPTAERWFGVTYRQDMPVVRKAVRELVAGGVYPRKLWD